MFSFSDADPILLVAIIALVVLLIVFLVLRYTRSKSPVAVADIEQNGIKITVKYCQPYKKDRTVFGGLVPYGKVWRTGANTATTITVNRNVFVADQPLNKGSYSLYTIPTETDWTLIFNSKIGQWGTRYDQTKDVLRVSVSTRLYPATAEQFFISFEPRPDGTTMLLTWDQTQVVVPFRKR